MCAASGGAALGFLRFCNGVVQEQIVAFGDVHAAASDIAVCRSLLANRLELAFHVADKNSGNDKADNKGGRYPNK